MSVKIELPISALADPAVAKSVANLFKALGAAAGPARRGASLSDVPPATADSDTRYRAFMDALPERSRRFLELVEARGELSIDEAMAALDVKVGKAMGGITGSIARWAPEHNVSVPFKAVKGPNGKRAWRWIGRDIEPPPPIPVRARRRRRKSPSAPIAAATDDAKEPPAPRPKQRADHPARHSFEDRLTALKATLPAHTERFLSLLEARGELSQAEVLSHFGLARAVGLRPILRPLHEGLAASGLGDLFVSIVSATGERSWAWGPRAEPSSKPAVSPPIPRDALAVRRRRKS